MNATVITGIIITAAIIVPIWWLIHSQSAGKRKLQKEITAMGKGYDINITEHESWSNKVIGIDREGEKAAYAIFGKPSNQVFIADLKLFSRCFVEKILLNSGTKYDNDIISTINIHFVSREKGARDLVFPVFVDSVDLTLGSELHVAEEWVDKFNGIIHKKAR